MTDEVVSKVNMDEDTIEPIESPTNKDQRSSTKTEGSKEERQISRPSVETQDRYVQSNLDEIFDDAKRNAEAEKIYDEKEKPDIIFPLAPERR